MRDIHRRLDDFTLTRVALSCYKDRLILGAVAGPFVGLFINLPSGVTSTLNAEPQLMTRLAGLGLASLAGFSVDLLFGVLERLTALVPEVSPSSHSGRTSSRKPEARMVQWRTRSIGSTLPALAGIRTSPAPFAAPRAEPRRRLPGESRRVRQ